MAGRVSCVYAYLSTSTLRPDFNSTVPCGGQIMICFSQRLTRASSNTVRLEDWSLMKSCNSVMRCSCSSRCTVSIEACWRFSLSAKIWSALEDFIKLTKATRFHYCINTEVYTDFLDVVVNAKLRNAIGHNDVEYDAVSQLITYIPNPKDRTKKKTEYLLEFENEAMHMFQGILGISEYLYRLMHFQIPN